MEFVHVPDEYVTKDVPVLTTRRSIFTCSALKAVHAENKMLLFASWKWKEAAANGEKQKQEEIAVGGRK